MPVTLEQFRTQASVQQDQVLTLLPDLAKGVILENVRIKAHLVHSNTFPKDELPFCASNFHLDLCRVNSQEPVVVFHNDFRGGPLAGNQFEGSFGVRELVVLLRVGHAARRELKQVALAYN